MSISTAHIMTFSICSPSCSLLRVFFCFITLDRRLTQISKGLLYIVIALQDETELLHKFTQMFSSFSMFYINLCTISI
jgi:hypothetical protein